MKIYLTLLVVLFSGNCFADADWCDEEGSYDKEYCEIETNDFKINKLMEKFKTIINENGNKYPKYKEQYIKIYNDARQIIEIEKSSMDKKCTFEHENYLYMNNLISRGSGESKYLSMCMNLYQKNTIVFLEKIIESCVNIDSDSNLPCRYEQFDFFYK